LSERQRATNNRGTSSSPTTLRVHPRLDNAPHSAFIAGIVMYKVHPVPPRVSHAPLPPQASASAVSLHRLPERPRRPIPTRTPCSAQGRFGKYPPVAFIAPQHAVTRCSASSIMCAALHSAACHTEEKPNSAVAHCRATCGVRSHGRDALASAFRTWHAKCAMRWSCAQSCSFVLPLPGESLVSLPLPPQQTDQITPRSAVIAAQRARDSLAGLDQG
jgi:hypothetical protein